MVDKFTRVPGARYARIRPMPGLETGPVVVVHKDNTVDLGPQVAVSEEFSLKAPLRRGQLLEAVGKESGGVTRCGIVQGISFKPPEDFVTLVNDYAHHEKEFLAHKPAGWDQKMQEIGERIARGQRVTHSQNKRFSIEE